MKLFHDPRPFMLESGGVLPGITIAYRTYGTLSASCDNVVWVCHSLTANSDAMAWWSGVVGPGAVIDTSTLFVVCANVIGSCYGSTPAVGYEFPLVSIRDQVRAFIELRKHLGVDDIKMLIGGSMGGQHVLEWVLLEPDVVKCIVPIATGAKQSPWATAFNSAQRFAIQSDPTFYSEMPNAGATGLVAARAIGMISYRTPLMYNLKQESLDERLEGFPVESYLRHQGLKLTSRFSAHSYFALTRSMDTHDVGRGRASTGSALRSIRARCLAIGIDSDILFPEAEQQFIADMIPGARYRRLSSPTGHDAFLTDQRQLSTIIRQEGLLS